MKLNDLKYYQALVKYKTFRKLQQNSMSVNLYYNGYPTRKRFGTSFFVRDHVHKQLHITPTGQRFAVHVNII